MYSMALASGTRLGPYEIAGSIGAGGMGEVYRAKDTRLGRTVAIKVLPPDFAADPERERRFEQEARAVSALNHPNICALYDIGLAEVPGGAKLSYLVMEYLDGQSLADRLVKGPLPLREVLEIGAQVADALSRAHRQGIIHRDIKPANVILTKEGAKLLDFGLAKARPSAADAGKTLSIGSTPLTQAGFVAGTVPYMAPEQLEGLETDARTDIFAFGAMLYEMLSGRRAFDGGSQASIIAAIMTSDPPSFAERQPVTPPALERLIRQCLAKDPDKRWQSAGDIARHLEGLLEELRFPSTASRMAIPAASPRSRVKRLAVLGAGALVFAALIGLAFILGRRAADRPLPTFHRLTFRRGSIQGTVFTPDGQSVIYTARWDGGPLETFTARADGVDSVLRDGLRGYNVASISSNNELALVRSSTLSTAPLTSGAPRNVLTQVTDADWSPDGTKLAVIRGGTIEYPSGKVIYRPRLETASLSGLSVSPRGDRLAFFEHQLGHGFVLIIDTSGRRTTESAFHDGLLGTSVWTPAGDEVWFTIEGEAVRAMNLAGRERSVLRSPKLRLEDISRDGRALLVSRDTLVNINGKLPEDEAERDLTYYGWSLVEDVSCDGRTLLFDEGGESDPQNGWNIFLRGMDGSPPQRLAAGYTGRLSPDGKWVAAVIFPNEKDAQFAFVPTGPGEARPISGAKDQGLQIVGWLPDGSGVIYMTEIGGLRGWLAKVDGSPPSPITPPGWWVGQASPDSKYVVAENGPSPNTDQILYLYSIDGREKIPLPIDSTEWGIFGFQDARHLRAGSNKEGGLQGPEGLRLPRRIYLLDIKTGKAELWKELGGQLPRAGLTRVSNFRFSADGNSYAYNYTTNLTTLYVANGLR
jgi:eukaryotic-like serine/threonine-protein kinase